MLKKLLLVALVLVFVVNVNAQFTKEQINRISSIEYKIKQNGDAFYGVRADGKSNAYGLSDVINVIKNRTPQTTVDGFTFTLTQVFTGAQSIYDLCSNGVPQFIWQDPATPDNIHCVFMTAPAGDPGFTDRKSKYYLSTDRGVTWSFMGEVPAVRSGFPAITGFSDGSALIANHTADGGGSTRAQAYKDAAAGLGSFTRLDAPGNNAYIWPRIITTSNVSIANKFMIVASMNGQDTTKYAINTDFGSTPGVWTPWTWLDKSDQAETYAMARGADGRIGIVFKNNDTPFPDDYADVWFLESTNNGTSFSTPLKIFDANFATDSLGPVRGVSIVYAGNSPKVVFETIKQTTAGSFFPGAPAKIRFWSSSLPGTDPNKSIVISDTTMIGWHPYVGVNDVMSSMCRPSIGVSADGNALFCAFMAPSDNVQTIADTTTFKDIYITVSGNQGASWNRPKKLNPATPIRDWTYPSVSPVNDNTSSTYYFNMVACVDSIAGSYVNGAGNGESLAKFMFLRVAIPAPVFINKISNEVPAQFSLSQNYPNPFNPVTKINFAVSKAGIVTLKIYDAAGKEVSTLVNQNLSAGTYDYSFNASNLPSGVYFYSLVAGDFKETKKMMLIK